MARRVLVTGGAGYIGAHAALDLAHSGAEVVVFDDLSAGHRAACAGELIEGDIRDRRLLRKVLERGFDGVLHFAALALVAESAARPALYHDVNVGGTCALLQAMQETGTSNLVFSSSCSVYGDPERNPVDEGARILPLSVYGRSKALAESVIADAGIAAICLRYFNAAGADPLGRAGESHAVETHLIPLALQARLGQRPPLPLYGRDHPTPDGSAVRDFVHVSDLARAHRLALEHLWGGGAASTWNLGAGQGRSVLEVLEAVRRVTGGAVPTVDAPRRPGDPAAVWADTTRARAALGWTPEWDLDAMVEHAWRWARGPRY